MNEKIQPRWLKLTAASKYAAINVHRLKALATSGRLRGFRDPDSTRGDWIFDRDSLDSYRLSQYTLPELETRALKILSAR
jgi:hypothetical protein